MIIDIRSMGEATNVDSRTKLEMIADDFVEDYLLNNPIMVYSLDTYLAEWIADHRKELEADNNHMLDEILSQHLRIRSNDKEIDNEIINGSQQRKYLMLPHRILLMTEKCHMQR